MIPAECSEMAENCAAEFSDLFFSYPAVPIIHSNTCWVLGDLIPAGAHRYMPSEKSEYKKKN